MMELWTEVMKKFSNSFTDLQGRKWPLQPLDTHTDEVNPADSPTIQKKATIKQDDDYSHL